jgi:hypothetical protein
MKSRNDNYLKELQRRREAASTTRSSPSTEKPIEEMTDTELDQALTQTKRALLDAQHQELRELARVQGRGPEHPSDQGRTLSDVLRELQRGKKRTWR